MYGGPSKLGGRGGGRNNRLHHTSFTPPPHRTSAPKRVNHRAAASGSGTALTAMGSEETFNLVRSNNPLAFGMVVKLTADFAEEIKKVGAQGGPMRVKFDRLNNSSMNVIDVGGKEFNFNWFRDNCDIYEERQSGDDGDGLLVEYGCSWRKLNVQRILDESTKQQYKKRSEEAERMQKARKAIVLDHENPSMKSQIKQMAAVEANPRMHFRNKKEHPIKKRRPDPPPVGSAPKSAFRSGPSYKSTAKIRLSTPPAPSPPDQFFTQQSPGIVNTNDSHATNKDLLPTEMMSKDTVASSGKKFSNNITNAVQETKGNKGTLATKSEDLQSMLISLLMENPKGMNLKALEKAVCQKIPNSAKQIEPIIKKIATFQAPGRYILKQGMELESFKKPLPEGRSSPEDNHHFSTGNKEICDQAAQESDSRNKGPIDEVETHTEANPKDEDELVNIVDIIQHSPDLPGIKKDFDISNARGGSSTDTGSDSDTDSDSSDSESDSGSPSKSRSKSPAESGSGSSSDSDSDISSNSKDGSDVDVDVDIIGDDDKGPEHNLKFSEPGFSSSPIPWRSDEQPVQNGLAGNKQDGGESDAFEIEKGMLDYDQEPHLNVVPNEGYDQHAEGTNISSPDHDKLRQCREYIGKLFDEGDDAGEDSLRNDQSDSYERTHTGKSKRCDDEPFDGKSKRVKRSGEERLAQPSISDGRIVRVSGSPHSAHSDRHSDRRNCDLYKGPNSHSSSRGDMESNAEEVHAKRSSDSQQSGRKSSNQSWQAKAAECLRTEERVESAGPDCKYTDKGSYGHDSFLTQKSGVLKNRRYESSYVNEKRIPSHTNEANDGGRNTIPLDSHHRKHGESAGKFKEAGQVPNSSIKPSPKENFGIGADRSPAVNGRGSILQRELSDMELGELREPLPDDVPGRKQFERKNSFKQSGSDCNKVKSGGKGTINMGMLSSPYNDTGAPNNLESSQKWSTPDRHIEDKLRSHHRIAQSQPQQPARVDHESGPQFNNLADAAIRPRQGETGVSKRVGPEGYENIRRRELANTLQKHDPKRGIVSNSTKENTRQIVSNGSQKRRESSSDENSSYSKYEKDEPELKEPIRDFSQYEDYVQEYRDKYDSYCSLNKVLESYRNEFQKLGKDLEAAKGRDTERYFNILDQMKESYRQCGTRHKRLKKIFIILHEELKNLKQRIKDFALTYTRD